MEANRDGSSNASLLIVDTSVLPQLLRLAKHATKRSALHGVGELAQNRLGEPAMGLFATPPFSVHVDTTRRLCDGTCNNWFVIGVETHM